MHDDFLGTDSWSGQRARTITQLGHAYVLARQLGEMNATSIDELVCTLLEAGAAEEIDAVLEHLDVASGAWRELTDEADRAIECVAAALTRQALARAAVVETGNA